MNDGSCSPDAVLWLPGSHSVVVVVDVDGEGLVCVVSWLVVGHHATRDAQAPQHCRGHFESFFTLHLHLCHSHLYYSHILLAFCLLTHFSFTRKCSRLMLRQWTTTWKEYLTTRISKIEVHQTHTCTHKWPVISVSVWAGASIVHVRVFVIKNLEDYYYYCRLGSQGRSRTVHCPRAPPGIWMMRFVLWVGCEL